MVAVNGAAPFTVDLDTQRISGPGGADIAFDIPAADRMRLLEGLDDIGLTLKHTDEIVDVREAAHGGGAAVAADARTATAIMTVEESEMTARKKLRAHHGGQAPGADAGRL